MRDRNSVFLVQAQQHLRLHVADVVDQAVVQAAVTGSGIQGDERNAQRAQGVRDDIAAEQRIAGVQRLGALNRGAGAIGKVVHRTLAVMLCILIKVVLGKLSILGLVCTFTKEWPNALRCLGRRHPAQNNFRRPP